MERPSPDQCALLLLRDIKEYWETKKKKATRFNLSERKLKAICKRVMLKRAFVEELQESLLDYGWALFSTGSVYGMIMCDSVSSWTQFPRKLRGKKDIIDYIALGKEMEDLFCPEIEDDQEW